MNRRRFSPATAALVVILVGALYMVGKAVNPPPPGPPEQVKPNPEIATKPSLPPPAMATAEVKHRMEQEMWQSKIQLEREEYARSLNHGKPLPPTDEITPVYFRDHDMGAGGVKKVDVEAARIKDIQDKVNKKFSGLKPPTGASKMPTPSSVLPAPGMKTAPTPVTDPPK